ncbi:Type III effector HopPmaJ [Flavobacterium cauense R2A-7]|uniref:HopJ type III effector protein n=1 Tax=Flavobacterium cauense R2A-7 TaxID=1341154 RepID=V6S3E6_9FLAO|nr:HopJ type III effector protein [Flavobacterium cauense]ESU18915.1 Type III effector HopPmaJ [Flavobacterium cauense R2A-7]KGO82448.1 type III effector [Flavobacterium cauense R2A-7]TWI15426.1 HopJ type III effector protein [Flavobacterium cauense R2A-7]
MKNLIDKIQNQPETILFPEVIEYIDSEYDFTPTRFTNGNTVNEANQNNGSCKIFFFAKIQGLTTELTLHLFGDFYRIDVQQNPEGTNHQNIRNFMKSGWEGIQYDGVALQPK